MLRHEPEPLRHAVGAEGTVRARPALEQRLERTLEEREEGLGHAGGRGHAERVPVEPRVLHRDPGLAARHAHLHGAARLLQLAQPRLGVGSERSRIWSTVRSPSCRSRSWSSSG